MQSPVPCTILKTPDEAYLVTLVAIDDNHNAAACSFRVTLKQAGSRQQAVGRRQKAANSLNFKVRHLLAPGYFLQNLVRQFERPETVLQGYDGIGVVFDRVVEGFQLALDGVYRR